MSTLKFKATEMKSAQVERISLVERGANRIPFRVIKEDRNMKTRLQDFDLASVFKREKHSDKPTVVGIITMKSDEFDAVKAEITAAGFTVEHEQVMEDTSVIFKQAEGDLPKDVVIVKLSDKVAVAMKGFSPYSVGMSVADGTSFNDACIAQGFYPNVGTMVDVLRSSVYEVTSKADDPAEASAAIESMFNEARDYCVSMVKSLPTAAFKLELSPEAGEEGADEEVVKGDKPNPFAKKKPGAADAEDAKDGGADDASEGADGKKKAPAKKEGDGQSAEEAAAEAAAAAAEAAKNKETPAEEKPVVKAEAPDLAAILGEALGKLETGLSAKIAESVLGVQKSVDTMTESIAALDTRIGEVESVAKAASETTVALKGAVMGSVAGDHATQTQKSDKGGHGGREIDTAYTPVERVRRPAR